MRIAVAMSGGVDSSVAAAVLKAQGHEVVGLTMKLWVCASALSPAEQAREAELAARSKADACCSPKDVLDAKEVCATLGIPHYLLEMASDFSQQVVDPFIAEYARARTPSPCVRCNERIKSKGLVAKARALGCEKLATGHYARIAADPSNGRFRLRTGEDESRDQSYFLFPITQDELAYFEFPVGRLSKPEVRRIAAELGLRVAEKPDSHEICFVKDDDHRRFLRDKTPALFVPGPIFHVDGRRIGEHEGMIGYTIGQRRGLRVAWSEPLYVTRLDLERNAVILGPEEALLASGLEALEMHWIDGTPPGGCFRAQARIRYRTPPAPCTIQVCPGGRALFRFDEPVRAVTPGQAVVVYAGDIVLGGGWIERALSEIGLR